MKYKKQQEGSSGRGLSIMIMAGGVFVAGLAIWLYVFVPAQTVDENNTGLYSNVDHIDVISSDPSGVKDGFLETRCYKADAPDGYGTTSTDGCAAVLTPKEGGGVLTAVYISQHWDASTFDQVYNQIVNNIKEMKKNNPKVQLVNSSRTTINGNNAWIIDYKDPYELDYRDYIIEAPEGKFSYNGRNILAFSVTGYLSQQFGGSEPPVDTVAKKFEFVQ